MKNLFFILLLLRLSVSGQLPLLSTGQQGYKINKPKIIGFSIVAFSGFMDGIVEGYEFDRRKSFERKWGADPYGFFGSQSWRKKYEDPNIWNEHFGVFDFYHLGDDLRKTGYVSGGIIIGIGGKGQKFKHYLFDFLISLAISGLSKKIGMNWVRN